MNIESSILGGKCNNYIIGCQVEVEGFRSVPAVSLYEAASYFRSEYPKAKRYINISNNALQSVKAAISTSSGLFDEATGKVLVDNINTLSKTSIVKLVMSKPGRLEQNIDFAADELGLQVLAGEAFESALSAFNTDDYLSQTQTRELLQASVQQHAEKIDETVGSFEHLLTYTNFTAANIADSLLRVPRRALLQLPTGFGKSSVILKKNIEESMTKGKRVLFVSPLRAIVKSLDIPGLVDYEKVEPGDMQTARGLKIVVNSLTSPKFADFLAKVDLVVIDEASQVIEHLIEGTVDRRSDVWNALKRVVYNARNVVFADADINRSCLEMISRGTEPVFVFKALADHSDIQVEVGQVDRVRKQAMETAKLHNTLICCDIRKDAEAMALELHKEGRSVLLMSAKTLGFEAQLSFLQNPDSTDHDVLIYTPAMKSAISIVSGHFTHHFALFEGSVTPKGCIQMLRRDRIAKSFVVGVRNPQRRRSELVDVEYKYGPQTAFEEMRHGHRKNLAWLRDNIQLALPIELRRQGFKVTLQQIDDELGKTGFKEHSKARKALKSDIATNVLAATPMDSLRAAERVLREGADSESDYYSAVKTEALHHLKQAALDKADALFWKEGEGRSKLLNYKSMVKPTTPLTVILNSIFMGMTTTKTWNSARSVKAYDALNEMRDQVLLAGFAMPKNSKFISDRSKQGFISEVMRACGLKTKRRDGGKSGDYYTIDEVTLVQIQGYTGLCPLGTKMSRPQFTIPTT